MAFSLDPQVGAALAAMYAEAGDAQPPAVGDVASRRQNVEALQTAVHGLLPMPDDVTMTDYEAVAEDGATILLRWYSKNGSTPGSAVLYTHGCELAR